MGQKEKSLLSLSGSKSELLGKVIKDEDMNGGEKGEVMGQ